MSSYEIYKFVVVISSALQIPLPIPWDKNILGKKNIINIRVTSAAMKGTEIFIIAESLQLNF